MKVENEIISGNEQVKLENGTIINRYSHVLAGAEIGDECMIGQGCFIGSDVKIGKGTRIQNFNSIWNGVWLGEFVFVGPSVVFTNHHNPSDRFDRDEFIVDRTIVKDKATICANSTIIAPCTINEGAMVAAGSVVLRDVAENEKVWGIVKKWKAKA